MTSPPNASPERRPELDDAPPLLGSWRAIYVFVLITLAVLIVAMWALGKVYA